MQTEEKMIDIENECIKTCLEKQFKKNSELTSLRDQYSKECNPSFIAQKNEDGYSPEKGAMEDLN